MASQTGLSTFPFIENGGLVSLIRLSSFFSWNKAGGIDYTVNSTSPSRLRTFFRWCGYFWCAGFGVRLSEARLRHTMMLHAAPARPLRDTFARFRLTECEHLQSVDCEKVGGSPFAIPNSHRASVHHQVALTLTE